MCERDRDVVVFARLAGSAERLGGDADDGEGNLVELDRAADGGGVAGEVTLPETIRDDGDRRGVGAVVLGGERPADPRLHAESAVVFAGGKLGGGGGVGRAVDEDIALPEGRKAEDGAEDVLLRGELVDRDQGKRGDRVTSGDGIAAAVAVARADGESVLALDDPEDHQFLRLADGERAQQQFVDETKDGGVRPDAEGERKHRGEREARRLDQLTKGKAQVGEHVKRRAERLEG